MSTNHLTAPQPLLTSSLFLPVNEALLALLRGLGADEWNAPTVAGDWTVKDVAAHLLATTLGRLSVHRDGYTRPEPPETFASGIVGFINTINRDGVACLRRLSPRILIEMHEQYGREMAELFESLDPYAPALWSVSWAGEEESANWFDVARELTERWHHQEQIRDATGRPPLFEYLAPVLDTFVRALPHTYRDVAAPEGTSIVLRVTREGEGVWTLIREGDRWVLYAGAADSPTTAVTLRGDHAWRIFTKQKIDPQARIEGDERLVGPLLGMVSIIG
jgi:uncharacterized protein (TIGR03083 family)